MDHRPPAVQLERQIEAFCAHRVEEQTEFRRIFPGVFRSADSPGGGQLDNSVNCPWAPAQIGPVPGFSQQYDFGVGKGRAKRLEGRKTEDVVADAVGTKHGDLANLTEIRHGFIPLSMYCRFFFCWRHDGGVRTVSGSIAARSRSGPENDAADLCAT
ncbi:hypothetical protein [Aromatoleum aromaticum]|uniref:hypothetical protein n=1 Tax=Aromatoleum aromaticum TaxID=551760 RepID=UPI00083B7F14|nr:hypothetical protein [Aromatoleum aromaticum]